MESLCTINTAIGTIYTRSYREEDSASRARHRSNLITRTMRGRSLSPAQAKRSPRPPKPRDDTTDRLLPALIVVIALAIGATSLGGGAPATTAPPPPPPVPTPTSDEGPSAAVEQERRHLAEAGRQRSRAAAALRLGQNSAYRAELLAARAAQDWAATTTLARALSTQGSQAEQPRMAALATLAAAYTRGDLRSACAAGELPRARGLLNMGVAPDSAGERDERGRGPLFYAADGATVRLILEFAGGDGAIAGRADGGGDTALCVALAAGRVSAATDLATLGAAASVGASCAGGESALTLALRSSAGGASALALSLLGHFSAARLKQLTSAGEGALHLAAAAGDVGLVRALVGAGAAVDLVSARGATALHTACLAGAAPLVTALLELGADATRPDDSSGELCSSIAQLHGHVAVSQLPAVRDAADRARRREVDASRVGGIPGIKDVKTVPLGAVRSAKEHAAQAMQQQRWASAIVLFKQCSALDPADEECRQSLAVALSAYRTRTVSAE